MDWLSIVGSIASIIGAIWAWREAIRSSNSASKAEQIKIQMINQRKTSELSELKTLVSEALESIKRYSTTMTSSLIGADTTNKENEAAKVQSLLNKIVEFDEYFSNGFASDFFDKSHSSLQSFLSAETPADLKKFGMELHRQIVDFSSILRKTLTEKKETTT